MWLALSCPKFASKNHEPVKTKTKTPTSARPNRLRLYQKLSVLALLATFAGKSHAGFTPIPLADTSYNVDLIVEKAAATPPSGVTTATMDGGVANNANTWYEAGYNTNALTTGLPAAGSTVTNVAKNGTFIMPSGYAANNAALVDGK